MTLNTTKISFKIKTFFLSNNCICIYVCICMQKIVNLSRQRQQIM